MESGFIEVRHPEAISLREVAAAAAATGASFALVFQGDTPVAFIPIPDADTAEDVQLMDRVDDATSLSEADVEIERLVVPESLRTFFTDRFAILLTDSGPAVLEADSPFAGADDLRSYLDSDSLRQVTMQSRLPGPPPDLDDPLILYRCSNRHYRLQHASDRNRVCPDDQGVLSL